MLRSARALVTLGLSLAPLAGAGPISPETKQEVVNRLQEVLTRQAYVGGVDFSLLRQHLQGEREMLNRATTEEMFAGALQQSLRQFGISHVGIIPPEAASGMHRSASIGIGAPVRPAPGGLRVLGVSKGSPADRAGLRAGDVITEVDGTRVTSPDALEGPIGSIARLRVRRLSGQMEEIRVQRQAVELRQASTLDELSPRTAIVRIRSFAQDYEPAEIEELFDRAFEYENLIIDLRGNGGGAVRNLMHLMGLLIPEFTPLGTPVSNRLAAAYVSETGGDPTDARAVAEWATTEKMIAGPNVFGPYPGRVAVLIDGGSASASEVTSSALRELRGSLIVGTRSAGALLVSTYVELPAGFAAQIPISDYITIKGFRPEGEGVVPDIEVSGRREDVERAAREALEK
ncbi:MAG: PDZ domain-containing protein [Leptolyngbya sp. PLA1]|nr:PDZ domain-containing protein [Leptolyngbya sp. PLA1]